MVQNNWVAAAIGMAGLGIGLRLSNRESQARLTNNTKGSEPHDAHLLRMVESLVLEINPRAVIKRIIEIANQMIQAERLTLLVVDAPRRELLITNSGDAEGIRLPMGRGIAGYVAETGQKVNTANAYNDPRFDRSMDDKMGFKTGSVLCIPVVGSHGQTVAVLQAINKQGTKGRRNEKKDSARLPFNEKDERALEYLAAHAGFTLQNALLHQQASRAQRTADAMLRLVKSQNNNVTFSMFVQNVLDALYNLLLAERVTVYLVDPIKKMLWISSSKDGLQGLRIPFGKGISGWVAEHRTPVNVQDAYHDPRFDSNVDLKTGFRTKSVLCYPVIPDSNGSQNVPIAVIQALNKVDGGFFDRDDEKAMEAFSAEFAVGLKRRAVEALLAEVMDVDSIDDGRGDDDVLNSIREIEVSFLEQFTPYSENDQVKTGRAHGIQALVSSDDEESSQSNHPDDDSNPSRVKTMCRRHSADTIPGRGSSASTTTTSDRGSEFLFHTKVTVTGCSPKHRSFRPKLLDTRKHRSCSQLEATATLSAEDVSSTNSQLRPNTVTDFRWSVGLSYAMRHVDPLKFKTWNFSILQLENMEDVAYSIMALAEMGGTNKFGSDPDTLEQFVCAVKQQYNASNSYHNFSHALQVAHCSFMFLNTPDVGTDLHLSSFDSYCLLVAALCHDIDHPGTNNAFEIASESDKYLVYGNNAVLERHHVQTTMKLLRNKETNIFANLPKEKVAMARRHIAAGILSTDMAYHFVLIKELQEELLLHAKNPDGPHTTLPCSDKSRQLIFNALLHTADLSAQAVNPEDALKWGDLVLSEFEDQADQEDQLGLPVTPFMKDLWDKTRRCQVQVGFVQNIVIPLWEVMAEIFPSKDVKQCVENLSKVQELYSSGI